MASSHDPSPHFVRRYGRGNFKCDPDDPQDGCLAFKKDRVCSHVVASAMVFGEFDALLQERSRGSKETNLTDIAMHCIASGVGKKKKHQQKRRNTDIETVTLADEVFRRKSPLKVKIVQQENGEHVAVPKKEESFYIDFLDSHPQVKRCEGCIVKFPRRLDGKPFAAPDNVLLKHQEQGSKRLPNGVLKVFETKNEDITILSSIV